MPLIDPAMWDLTRLFATADVPPPPPPKTKVRPVRVHVPDHDLHTTIVRTFGFRALASDGWRGPVRKTYAEAREDARRHRGETT